MNSCPSKHDDADRRAVARRDHRPLAADRFVRQIRRPDDVRLALERRVDLLAAIDVVAERDRIDARGDQLAVDLRRQPRAAGGVLGVGDHQIELALGDKPRHGAAHNVAPGLAHNVADEEDSHGRDAQSRSGEPSRTNS